MGETIMNNQAQGTIKLHLVKNTDKDEESFQRIMHEKNIVAAKLQLVSSNGEVHNMDLADVLSLLWTNFESFEDDEEEKDHQAATLMTKIIK
jgi:hypothetical protein